MIIRIVKMSFQHDAADAFQSVFEDAQPKISTFPGCQGVILLRDILHPHIFFTYSTWNSHTDLETYRESELFKTTWAAAKALFNDKPEAWSVEKVI